LDEDSLESEREFDLSAMSAMDYLKQVRSERKKIPQVVTVHPLRESEASASSTHEVSS
jgi:Survival motor neuron (SMN) interacting protein 1 (SIP1)